MSHRWPQEGKRTFPCIYMKQYGCGFVATSEEDLRTHVILHVSFDPPAKGSLGELRWLQLGVKLSDIVNRVRECPKCDASRPPDRFDLVVNHHGLRAIKEHIQQQHPELDGGAKEYG